MIGQKKSRYFLSVVVALVLVMTFFWKIFFAGGHPFAGDLYFYVYPNMDLLSKAVSEGILPFWNPYLKGGVPFLADPAVALLYPFHIFFFLFEFSLALKLFILFHYGLALGGTYYCARRYGLSPPAALLAGFTLAFSGYLVSMAGVFTKLRGLAWVPLLFGLAQLGREKKSLWPWAGAGLCLGMILLAGHLFAAYLAILFLFIEWLVEGGQKGRKILLSRVGPLAVLVALGLGISALQWIPSVMILESSERSRGLDQWSQDRWPLETSRLVELAAPGGNSIQTPEEVYYEGKKHWAPSIYFGLWPLLLGLAAPFLLPWRKSLFWLIMAFTSFLLALGSQLPFLEGAGQVLPFLDRLRFPEKFFFWTTFAFALLAGQSFDRLKTKTEVSPRAFLIFLLALPAAFFLFPSAPGFWSYLPQFWTPLIRSLCLALAGALLLYYGKRRPLLAFVFLALSWADVAHINEKALPVIKTNVYTAPAPRSVQALPSRGTGEFRISRYPFDGPLRKRVGPSEKVGRERIFFHRRQELLGNIYLLYDFDGTWGICPVTFWRYHRLFEVFPGSKEIQIYRLLGVRYLLASSLPPVHLADEMEIYRNLPGENCWYRLRDPQPRARLYGDVKKASSSEEAARLLTQIDIEKTLVIEGLKDLPDLTPSRKETGKVEVLSRSYNEIKVQVTATSPAGLALFESHSPGWRAFDEKGKEISLHYGQILFRSALLPPGRHIITFRYRPRGWRWGVALSLITMLVMIGWGSWEIFRRGKKREGGE